MDGQLVAVVNQFTAVDLLPPTGKTCVKSFTECGPTKRVWSSSACSLEDRLVPDEMAVLCTGIEPTLCELVYRNGEGDPVIQPGKGIWNPQSLPTQLVVDCAWAARDMVTCCDRDGNPADPVSCIITKPTPTWFVNQEETYARIRSYLDQYGRGANAAENIQNLNDNVLSWVCFLPSLECRNDTVGITPGNLEDDSQAGLPLTEPMKMCSMVNSSTPMGALCYDYYRSNFNASMEWRVEQYCSTYGVRDGQPVYPQEDGNTDGWDSGDYTQDCLCSQRWGIPSYGQVRKATGVVYEDACWFRPCIPDSNQLKPDIGMFSPTCPTTICQNIVNSIINVDDSENVVVDWDFSQYVNCSSGSTSSLVATEAAANEVKTSLKAFFIFAIVAFILLALVIVVAVF